MPPLNTSRPEQSVDKGLSKHLNPPQNASHYQPAGKIPQHEVTTLKPRTAPSTFPPFVAGKISQVPKRQAVPEVIIITPSPSKNEDANIEDLFANTPAYNPSFKALGPVYIPSVTEKYEIIEATPLEEVDPAMLGLPSGAVIKPASQVILQKGS